MVCTAAALGVEPTIYTKNKFSQGAKMNLNSYVVNYIGAHLKRLRFIFREQGACRSFYLHSVLVNAMQCPRYHCRCNCGFKLQPFAWRIIRMPMPLHMCSDQVASNANTTREHKFSVRRGVAWQRYIPAKNGEILMHVLL